MQRTFPSSIIYSPPADPSPNLQTVLAYVNARNENDADKIMTYMHDSLEHRILPKSLGRPVLNKRQYAEYLGGLLPMFKRYKMTLHEVTEMGDTIVLHASATGLSVKDNTFTNEYCVIFHLVPPDEEGKMSKISSVKEFVDSSNVVKFFAEEREKASALKERGISRSH